MAMATLAGASPAAAQNAGKNAVTSADDAFGGSIGLESTGIYTDLDIRGFNPQRAGNVRIEGNYFDLVGFLPLVARASTSIKIGFAAQPYSFPAPTGIVDYRLHASGNDLGATLSLTSAAYGSVFEQLDARIPVIKDRLSLLASVANSTSQQVDGGTFHNKAAALIPTITLGDTVIRPFVSILTTRDANTRPVTVTTGSFLPPVPRRRVFLGQTWALTNSNIYNGGLMVRTQLAKDVALRAGAFHSRNDRLTNFTEIFIVTNPSGAALDRVIADPRNEAFSNSWGAILAWTPRSGRWQHRAMLSARGRKRHTETGGSGICTFGPNPFGTPVAQPQPVFAFSPHNLGVLSQTNIMAGYFGRYEGLGQINLGLQKAHYRASFRDRTGVTRTAANPLLANASVQFEPTPHVALFAGFVRGLEDSGTAPETAANRNQQLPATITRQFDGGIRYSFAKSKLIAGLFQLEKPYFTFDTGNAFTEQGSVRHRGFELSYSGPVTKRLYLNAGGVFMQPRVSGAARDTGHSGKLPVGTPPVHIHIDANYRTELLGGLTPTLSLDHVSARAVSTATYAALGGEQLKLSSRTTVDLGARYAFKIGKTPASIRATVQNIFNDKSWRIVASNSLQPDDQRRVQIYLTADF